MIQRVVFFYKLIQSSSLPSKVGARYSTAQAATFIQTIVQSDDESNIDIDWENLGFNLMPTDYMYQTKSCKNGYFKQGQLNPYGNIQLSPSAGVLNYGQGIFEGTKAFKRDDGRLCLFRPKENAMRMQIGAERMCMPCPSIDQFVDAVKQTALANKRFIPPPGKGSLYIRPLLIGSGPILGLAPAPEYTFLVYACPVGNYFKEGTTPLNLYVEEDLHRASRGGAGGVKSITNYAPVLRATKSAKEKGFSDVLYLDSINKRYIEEVSSCNIFLVKGKILSTPATSGTILEGVTRKSIIDIAHDLGYQVEEGLIEVEELNNCDEVFCTGTAVGIASVDSITYKGKRKQPLYFLRGSGKVCVHFYPPQTSLVGFNWVGPSYFTAPAITSAQPSTYGDYESRDIYDWDNLGFKLIKTDYMFMARSSQNGNFEKGTLNPYGNIELSPSAGVLNYGQGLIEGTKAYRVDDGRIFLFRPQESGIRMQIGAQRMCMSSPSIQQFIHAIKLTTIANKRWIPPAGKGSLYIRPLLIGNGPILGIAPAPEYTFLVYACPVGNYLRNGTQPLTLYVEEEHHRASQGGAGGVKAITNYGPVIKAIQKAKERGYSDVLYLDSVNKKYIEEVSASNIFLVKEKIISTPIASGTILEGITRKSIIDIAHDLGYQVEERLIEAEELINADEVFCTGTALGVAPVGSITYKNKRINYKISSELISEQLNSRLVAIQKGIIEDKRDWLIEIK